MRIRKFGHACMLVEEGSARILIDPGAFSGGFEDTSDLDAILITHQHQDHLVPERIRPLVERSPEVQIWADEGSARILDEAGVAARVARTGDVFEVAGVEVRVAGTDHAVIHADVPGIPNVGYGIAGRFFYPGDNFTVPEWPVEILAAPAGAPWLKIGEAVDYARTVGPRVVIPVHEGVLSEVGKGIHNGALERLTSGRGMVIMGRGDQDMIEL